MWFFALQEERVTSLVFSANVHPETNALVLLFIWMSFSPSHLLSALHKWRLMSQFIHHRLLMIMAAGTKALLRCDGVFFGGGRGYLLFKRPRHSHGTTQTLRQKDGCWLPVEEPSCPASLPFASSSSTTTFPSASHHSYSLKPFYLFYLFFSSVFVSLNADCLTWFLTQQTESSQLKKKGWWFGGGGIWNHMQTHSLKQTEHYRCAVMTDRNKQPPSILM